ncbi:unnamed protein product [Durusdinium trenchii]|uniref:EF-hand domain-containing protein n=1 Tax=Durusdinium trenchii TaxID=1381693 RepID=A0ABP0IU87_9DINO
MDQEGGCTSQARRLALAHGDWEKAHGPLKGAQLGHLSRLQGYAPTEAQLKPYQESERISAENFVKFCEEVGYEDPSFEELSSVFAPFDPEGTGQIPKEVFLHLMTSVGDRFEAEEVDSMMVDLQSGKEVCTDAGELFLVRGIVENLLRYFKASLRMCMAAWPCSVLVLQAWRPHVEWRRPRVLSSDLSEAGARYRRKLEWVWSVYVRQ